MTCIRVTEVCSTDKRYALIRVSNGYCLKAVGCLSEQLYPEAVKKNMCANLPKDGTKTAPGPEFALGLDAESISGSVSLSTAAGTVVFLFTHLFFRI